MKKIIIDTNAYTAFMTGDECILDALAEGETTFLSAIVIGELHAGFRGGSKWSKNKAELICFQEKSTVRILDVTAETAELFGQVKHSLKKAGTPIPLNDVWLAAQAIETGSTIVTYDAHFAKVPGIRLWDHLN